MQAVISHENFQLCWFRVESIANLFQRRLQSPRIFQRMIENNLEYEQRKFLVFVFAQISHIYPL
jgi:hypothetical protein